MRQIDCLDGVQKDQKGEYAFVGPLLFGRKVFVEHTGVVLQPGHLFGNPEITDHDLVEGFRPGIFGGVEVEKSRGGTLDDGSVFGSIIPFGIEELVGMEYF